MMTSEKHASAKATATDLRQPAELNQQSGNNQLSGHAPLKEHEIGEDVNPQPSDDTRPNLTVISNNAGSAAQNKDAANRSVHIEPSTQPKAGDRQATKTAASQGAKVDAKGAALDKLVHEGDEGWLFLVAGSNHVLDMYQHKSSFTSTMAKGWVKLLRERTNRLASDGIQYLHLPAPEKLTVLHKFYRGEIENIEGSPIHQMANKHIAEVPCLVNVLPLFAKQVDKTLLYWKTDTHWSFWGCFSAYQLLCARMGVKPNVELLQYPYSEGPVLFDLGAKLEEPSKEIARFYQLTQNAQRSYANTMVRFKEEHGLINEANLHVGSSVVFKNESPNAINKCVVLFGDSFSEYREHLLTGMLAETFREVHFVWNGSIDYHYVDRIKPDVVITDHLHPPKVVQKECKNIGHDKSMKTAPIRFLDINKAKVFFTGDKLLVRAEDGELVKRYGVNENEFNALPWSEHRALH